MPSEPLSTSPRKTYDVSLITDDEEEDDDKDTKEYGPRFADEDSSGQDASSEAYSVEGSPDGSDAEIEGDENSAEGRSSSADEHQGQHTSLTGMQASYSPEPPTSTSKKGAGILSGTGPKLLPGSSRRPRTLATYNVLALSRQARGYTYSFPKQTHPRHLPSPVLDVGTRRRSEPPTYNLKELVHQTRGRPKGTRQLARKTTRRPAKGIVGTGGQSRSHARKRAVSGDSDDDGVSSKRRRIDPDTSIADSFASEGPAITELAIQKGDSASIWNPVAPGLWENTTTPPAFQGSQGLWQYISKWIVHSGSSDAINFTDDERIMKMLALPKKRSIEWNHANRNRWAVSNKIDIIALLLQVTGEEPPSPCSKCASGSRHGQWLGCMTMPSKLASEAWRIYGCANCVYHGKQTYCSLKSWNRTRATTLSIPAQPHQEKSHSGDTRNSPAKSRDHSEDTAAAAEITETRNNAAQDCGAGRQKGRDESGAAMRPSSDTRHDTSLLSAGQRVDMPMMEPWEKAPGRLRSRIEDRMESTAPDTDPFPPFPHTPPRSYQS